METIKAYLPLCWFRDDILRLPQSGEFLKKNLLFYFGVVFFIQFNMSDDIESIFEVILETLFTLAFIWLILLLNRSLDNFAGVCSAVLFVQNFISILVVPVVFWVTTTENMASYLALLILVIWMVLLVARIFKQILLINNSAALVVSLAYFIMIYGGSYALYSLVAG